MISMKRFYCRSRRLGSSGLCSLALCLLFLSGCEQTRPPSAEALKKIAARTATGTVVTKLEARSQPETPRAGEVSIWDLKVFDVQDKPDGLRQEWKTFAPLPQAMRAGAANMTDVLMNAWLISRDGKVFLPSRPSYKAYGSFVTDWTPPRPGAYTLFVEYQPDAKGDRIFPVELARWNFRVAAGDSSATPVSEAPHWKPSQNPSPITLHGAGDGEPAGALSIENLPAKAGDKAVALVKDAPQGIENLELVALSAGGDLLHFNPLPDGKNFDVVFPKSAMYRVWASFSLNGAPYAAPLNHWVSS